MAIGLKEMVMSSLEEEVFLPFKAWGRPLQRRKAQLHRMRAKTKTVGSLNRKSPTGWSGALLTRKPYQKRVKETKALVVGIAVVTGSITKERDFQ